jgi:diguanylate cyclase (GGDEF)-like protein/PAS domain S-box-containing protein
LPDAQLVPFQHLVEAAPMGVIVHVDGGCVVYANPTAEEMLGVGPHGGAGVDLCAMVHPSFREQFRHRCAELLAGRALPGSTEWTLVRPDGAEVVVESVESSLTLDDGRRAVFVMACDVTDRSRREAHLAHLATHDGLTGLPNRLLLLDRLSQSLSRIGRGCAAVAVVFVDLDGFKAVNDEHGHAVGDAVLCEVGRRLSGLVRAGDTVARLSGDEFVVCAEVEDDGAEDALRQRAAEVLAERYDVDGVRLRLGASVGVLRLSEAVEAAQALAEADRRMYEAKRSRPDHRR